MRSSQRCFCQLHITSGYIPTRLAQENIGILNKVDRVVLERSVRASGGAKPNCAGSETYPQHEEHCNKKDKLQQHANCATILIEEGDSLRLATPLFQIMPQIAAATGCDAFLTSWRPCAAAIGTATPIFHVEADQHEPEDPLHRSTARALTAIATQFQEQGKLRDPPNATCWMSETAIQVGQATVTPRCPHHIHAERWNAGEHNTRRDCTRCTTGSKPLPLPVKERRLTIACVEVTDSLAEDIVHIAKCLSINVIILLFHTTHRHNTRDNHNNSSTSGLNNNTRGHTPFASGPVTEPCTIRHRGLAEFRITCNAFGFGLYNPHYYTQALATVHTNTCESDTSTPPMTKAEDPHTPQDARDIAHRSGVSNPLADQCDDA